jgi:hypothetical protein
MYIQHLSDVPRCRLSRLGTEAGSPAFEAAVFVSCERQCQVGSG